LLCSLLLSPGKTAFADIFFSNNDSISVTINAINLSEDMSTLSSKNDEMLLLVYDFSDTSKLSSPLLADYFVLDSATRKKQVQFSSIEASHDVILVLAELDTDKAPEQVEKLIRKNFFLIMDCLDKKDLIALQKYIGDDDIIGIKVIKEVDRTKGIDFSFQGRYKLDKFLYKIEVKKVNR
jgi:hypothetical protein